MAGIRNPRLSSSSAASSARRSSPTRIGTIAESVRALIQWRAKPCKVVASLLAVAIPGVKFTGIFIHRNDQIAIDARLLNKKRRNPGTLHLVLYIHITFTLTLNMSTLSHSLVLLKPYIGPDGMSLRSRPTLYPHINTLSINFIWVRFGL